MLEPVMQELAQVRGGGQAALGVATRVAQTENRQLERDERLAMLALQRGDLNTFRFFGSRAGINLPDEVLNNQAQRRLIAAALPRNGVARLIGRWCAGIVGIARVKEE